MEEYVAAKKVILGSQAYSTEQSDQVILGSNLVDLIAPLGVEPHALDLPNDDWDVDFSVGESFCR